MSNIFRTPVTSKPLWPYCIISVFPASSLSYQLLLDRFEHVTWVRLTLWNNGFPIVIFWYSQKDSSVNWFVLGSLMVQLVVIFIENFVQSMNKVLCREDVRGRGQVGGMEVAHLWVVANNLDASLRLELMTTLNVHMNQFCPIDEW